MHELGVKRFFDVHGEMGIKLVNVDGHEWPKRAAITVNELRDAIVSGVRKEKTYNLDLDTLIDKIFERVEERNQENSILK
ncbi:hypothetical protein LCGC14_1060690 [marine sediment metagenome]|uniref:Uncharacterized protein n=1 Tax=marine sediment metagenome TaxID=412755 RepID=A0A0F9Q444_9ZZZZ|nr:hypothetical protein [Candidatus Aminicenantes bacterium]